MCRGCELIEDVITNSSVLIYFNEFILNIAAKNKTALVPKVYDLEEF